MDKFGNMFKELRKSRKHSQMKLAKAMNISQAFLSGVENDERLLSHDRLNDFSNFLNLTHDEKSLLFETWHKDCGVITINTCGYEAHQKRLLSCFFEHLENMDETTVNKILKICTEN